MKDWQASDIVNLLVHRKQCPSVVRISVVMQIVEIDVAGKKLEQKYARALAWMRQYGAAALLLSWVPIIGDPLCVVAGWLRIPFALALAVIAVAKTLRYAVLVAFV